MLNCHFKTCLQNHIQVFQNKGLFL